LPQTLISYIWGKENKEGKGITRISRGPPSIWIQWLQNLLHRQPFLHPNVPSGTWNREPPVRVKQRNWFKSCKDKTPLQPQQMYTEKCEVFIRSTDNQRLNIAHKKIMRAYGTCNFPSAKMEILCFNPAYYFATALRVFTPRYP
jgi:hypothetical protein